MITPFGREIAALSSVRIAEPNEVSSRIPLKIISFMSKSIRQSSAQAVLLSLEIRYLVVVKPMGYVYPEGRNGTFIRWLGVSNNRGHRAWHVHKGKSSELGRSVMLLQSDGRLWCPINQSTPSRYMYPFPHIQCAKKRGWCKGI